MSKQGWTGVVLAGGKSSRMGRDKALIEIDGRSLLDRALDKLDAPVRMARRTALLPSTT